MSEHVCVIGVSARAIAASARRAGFDPFAADFFCDVDLERIALCERMRAYPSDLLRAVDQLPPAPLVYAGALENYPELVDELATRRPLLGNPGRVLRAVRNPFRLAESVRRAGLLMPEIRTDPKKLPRDGRWLAKPYQGSGGTRVNPLDGSFVPPERVGDFYYQRRVEGVPIGALFVAAREDAVLLGVTRQIVGAPWAGAEGFRYVGSIGPLEALPTVQKQLVDLGQRLAIDFGLVGLFGVDAMLAGETLFPLEINPRYTASVEVLERALGLHSIRAHVEACRDGVLGDPVGSFLPRSGRLGGKAIMFADRDITVGDAVQQWAAEKNATQDAPQVADIPQPGTEIRARMPVLTVLAEGPSLDAVEKSLRQRVSELQQLLYGE